MQTQLPFWTHNDEFGIEHLVWSWVRQAKANLQISRRAPLTLKMCLGIYILRKYGKKWGNNGKISQSHSVYVTRRVKEERLRGVVGGGGDTVGKEVNWEKQHRWACLTKINSAYSEFPQGAKAKIIGPFAGWKVARSYSEQMHSQKCIWGGRLTSVCQYSNFSDYQKKIIIIPFKSRATATLMNISRKTNTGKSIVDSNGSAFQEEINKSIHSFLFSHRLWFTGSAVIDLYLTYVLMGCSGRLDNKRIKQVAMTKHKWKIDTNITKPTDFWWIRETF